MVQCLVVLMVSMVMMAASMVVEHVMERHEEYKALWARIPHPTTVMNPKLRDSVIYRSRIHSPSTRRIPKAPTLSGRRYPRDEVI